VSGWNSEVNRSPVVKPVSKAMITLQDENGCSWCKIETAAGALEK
jgi:hypothetical protein